MPKQKDGRYRAKITVGHVDGKPIVKYASGKTKKELEANKEELRRAFVTGAVQAQRDVLFNVYALEWYETHKKPHIGSSSRNNYASIMNCHVLPAFSGRQLRAVTANDLQRFLNGLAGKNKTTITYINTIIKGVFRTAYTDGIIDRDPTVSLKRPGASSAKRRALTEAETAAALKVGDEHPDGLILLLLYYTGARRGEALGLQWNDIDFVRREIHIRRDIDFVTNSVGDLKTTYSERTIPLPSELAASLDACRGIGETFILQSPKTHSFLPQATFSRLWKRLMKAMVEANPSIEQKDGASILTPHYFRHNYASVLYNAGVDILAAQKFLGHADVKTTLQIYAHLGEGKEMENAEKVREAFARA